MNWLKLITRSGRQSIARGLLKQYLTPQKVAEYAADGVNKLLAKVNDKDRLDRIAGIVSRTADLAGDVSDAVRDGHIDADEAAKICSRTSALVGDAITSESVDALIEKAVQHVP